LVAFGYASNALGTINPVAKLIRMAHDAGAWVYIDAVQYAPHGPIDVQALDCDFLTASSYKFFGPHAGVLYGKYEHLEKLTAYKVRPAPDDPPGKFETGTQNHEGIAGMLGAIEYLEWVGKTFGENYIEKYADRYQGRRLHLKQAMAAIHAYEYELSRALLEILEEIPGLTLYGLRDVRRLEERVPPSHLPAESAPSPSGRDAGRGRYLCVGWQLLCPGSDGAVRPGGEWRDGPRRRGALQHSGRGIQIARCPGKDCWVTAI
jgi:selenocysteine lyase/cysteine desulfurase